MELSKFGEHISKISENIDRDIAESVAPTIASLINTTAKNRALPGQAKYGGTGHLRQSIDDGQIITEPDKVTVRVTANAEYAAYVEYGTGSKGDPSVPHTSREKWAYYNENLGEFRTGYPKKARPFMRPALESNEGLIESLLAGEIVEVFDND